MGQLSSCLDSKKESTSYNNQKNSYRLDGQPMCSTEEIVAIEEELEKLAIEADELDKSIAHLQQILSTLNNSQDIAQVESQIQSFQDALNVVREKVAIKNAEKQDCYDTHFIGDPKEVSGTRESFPVEVVFINSSDKILTTDPLGYSQDIVGLINDRVQYGKNKYLKFHLTKVRQVVDDELFDSLCPAVYQASARYGSEEAITIIVNHSMFGSCQGTAFLFAKIKNVRSAFFMKYNKPSALFEQVVAHEMGHLFGMHHVADVYDGSVPVTGLVEENHILDIGGARDRRLCPTDFYYYIDPEANQTDRIVAGLQWNSAGNTMYPVVSNVGDQGYFNSDGYTYSMSHALDCYYQRNKGGWVVPKEILIPTEKEEPNVKKGL